MALSPGVKYLLSKLPFALAIPLATYFALNSLSEHAGFTYLDPYPWLRALIAFWALPLVGFAYKALSDLRTKVQARRIGAELFPIIRGSWPLSLDLILQFFRVFPVEYAGENFESIFPPGEKTIILDAVGELRVLTWEPQYIKHILTGNFPNYVKGEQLFGDATRSVLGVGVFNSDGEMWKFHRTLTRPFFVRDRISNFRIFEKHADEIIQIMKDTFRTGTPLNIQDVYARFTLDSATEFLFGECVHSVYEPMLLPGGVQPAATPTSGSSTPSHPNNSAFVRAFGAAQELVAIRVRTGRIWPIREMKKDKSEEFTESLHSYMKPIVQRGLARRAQLLAERAGKEVVIDEKAGIEEGMTLLDHLVLQTDDEDILRDSLMNMLIAGRDTTASLLTFVTYALSQHADVLAELRKEILEVVGPNDVPTYENIRELKYLRAVLNETLRLFPPVPLNFRESVESDVWVGTDGKRYFIPAKTTTAYSVIAMHREKEYWGEDALVFDPQRWLDERLARITANPFMFLPFNAGPRICLGQQFAYNEASFLLIRLLQSFSSITLRPDAQPEGTLPNPGGAWDLSHGRKGIEKVWPRTHLTMYVNGGMWATMGEAEM